LAKQRQRWGNICALTSQSNIIPLLANPEPSTNEDFHEVPASIAHPGFVPDTVQQHSGPVSEPTTW
jgi:hypothetical protein